MSQYRTVIRISQYNDKMGLVWATMIAWKNEPFWYPVKPFLGLASRQQFLTVSWQNPLRFICDANIYALDIAALDIKNAKIAEPPPEEWL